MTWGIVEGFVKWCLKEGYAVSTVNNRLSAVKVYAKLAAKAGVIPAEELQLIRVVSGYGKQEGKRVDERRPVTRIGHKKEAPVRLTPTQARTLKSQPDTPQGRRDALLMCLLLDHSLRVGEVVRLEAADFDLERGELRFYRPKVDIVQTHQLTSDTWRTARAYFRLDAPKSGRILLGSRKNGRLTKKPLSIRAIKKRVASLCRTQLNIENDEDAELSPHDCRHYWATDAARNGTDPFRLQEAGGWSSLAMPRRYVEAAEVANKGVKLSG
jgi:integrase